MKQPKKPTLKQKKWIASSGYDWHEWNVYDEDHISVAIINKKTGRKRLVLK